MAAQCRCAALGDGRHHLELRQAQVPALSLAPGWAVGAQDVGDLEGRSLLHGGGGYWTGGVVDGSGVGSAAAVSEV
jgi:hypothetical protein